MGRTRASGKGTRLRRGQSAPRPPHSRTEKPRGNLDGLYILGSGEVAALGRRSGLGPSMNGPRGERARDTKVRGQDRDGGRRFTAIASNELERVRDVCAFAPACLCTLRPDTVESDFLTILFNCRSRLSARAASTFV